MNAGQINSFEVTSNDTCNAVPMGVLCLLDEEVRKVTPSGLCV